MVSRRHEWSTRPPRPTPCRRPSGRRTTGTSPARRPWRSNRRPRRSDDRLADTQSCRPFVTRSKAKPIAGGMFRAASSLLHGGDPITDGRHDRGDVRQERDRDDGEGRDDDDRGAEKDRGGRLDADHPRSLRASTNGANVAATIAAIRIEIVTFESTRAIRRGRRRGGAPPAIASRPPRRARASQGRAHRALGSRVRSRSSASELLSGRRDGSPESTRSHQPARAM